MPTGVQRFSASWSAMTWLVTLAVVVVVVVATGAVLTKAERVSPEDESARLRLTAVALILPMILMICVLFAPLGYTIDDVGIVINRLGPNICILYSEVAEIRLINRRDLGFGVRLCASGGFFGFYGRFWSTRMGRFQAYVTDTKHLVLITRIDATKLLISPLPANLFVEVVENVRRQSQAPTRSAV
ncbi:MAG: hypothetical protein JSW27_01665 [Phycisphaerales bacterium]|nr:MAG: hypothetical protein JSW27_01665 [Phycisphaerales bacterium]